MATAYRNYREFKARLAGKVQLYHSFTCICVTQDG